MSIPKIIHYCWFGGNPLPEKDRKCIESWKEKCPEYKIIEWNESNYDICKNAYMKEAYDAHRWGFVPDYARLDIIYQYGGIYLDTDVELLRSLDDLLDQKAFMAFESETAVAPGLIIAAEPKNAIIKDMMDSIYGDRRFLRKDGTYDTVASPKMATEYLVKKGLECNNRLQMIDGLHIYPKEYFCPKDYMTGEVYITDNTYSIHHYNASWQTDKQRRWHNFEYRISRIFGNQATGTLRKLFVWRGIQVWYTKGFGYCVKRIFVGRSK